MIGCSEAITSYVNNMSIGKYLLMPDPNYQLSHNHNEPLPIPVFPLHPDDSPQYQQQYQQPQQEQQQPFTGFYVPTPPTTLPGRPSKEHVTFSDANHEINNDQEERSSYENGVMQTDSMLAALNQSVEQLEGNALIDSLLRDSEGVFFSIDF